MRITLAVLCAVIITAVAAPCDAQITLKNSIFRGWKYSVGGSEYQKVGTGAKGLRSEMQGCDSCLTALSSYTTCMTIGLVAGVPGGLLLGWPVGANIGGQEWTDGYTTMALIGGSLLVVDIVFETIAASKLKTAVRRYNSGRNSGTPSSPTSSIRLHIREKGLALSYSW